MLAPAAVAAALLAGQGRAVASPVYDHCYQQAATYYDVSADILRAIARVESGNNPAATNTNLDGSEDVGLMQINSWWLPRLKAYGITREHLLDPCTNISVGAWILRQEINQQGPTWKAIGRYNAKTPSKATAYGKKVFQAWKRSQEGVSPQPTGE